MKILIILFVFINLVLLKNDDNILWNENRKLVWEDFKCKPPKHTNFAAITSINFSFDYNTKGEISIVNSVDKTKSWSIKKLQTDYLLGHEQCHFDISEIYARKIRKEFSLTKNLTSKLAISIFKKYIKKYNSEQYLYDKETNHSKNKSKQIYWQNKVSKSLKDLDKFKYSSLE